MIALSNIFRNISLTGSATATTQNITNNSIQNRTTGLSFLYDSTPNYTQSSLNLRSNTNGIIFNQDGTINANDTNYAFAASRLATSVGVNTNLFEQTDVTNGAFTPDRAVITRNVNTRTTEAGSIVANPVVGLPSASFANTSVANESVVADFAAQQDGSTQATIAGTRVTNGLSTQTVGDQASVTTTNSQAGYLLSATTDSVPDPTQLTTTLEGTSVDTVLNEGQAEAALPSSPTADTPPPQATQPEPQPPTPVANNTQGQGAEGGTAPPPEAVQA